MLSNREKAITIIQGILVVGSKNGDTIPYSINIAYKLTKNLELDISFEEFGKLSMDIVEHNEYDLAEISFQLSNR